MKVGIIGAGTMGSGIAQAFAQVDGYEVCLCDINEEFASNGKLKISKNFEKRVAKGKMAKEDADKILARIHTGVKTICSDCDLVVEAAIENMEIMHAQGADKDKFFYCNLDIPYSDDEECVEHICEQVSRKILKPMCENYGVDTSDAAIRAAVSEHNEVCRILTEIGETRKLDNPPITGYEYAVLVLVSYVCPKRLILPLLRETLAEVKTREVDAQKNYRVRVAVVGSEIDDPDLIRLIESCGALVVADRYCYGSFPGRQEIVLTDGEDALTQVCRWYLQHTECPRQSALHRVQYRNDHVAQLVHDFKADGAIYEQMKFCTYWSYERVIANQVMPRDYGIHILSIDRPYIAGQSGQLRTRVQAFVESLEMKQLRSAQKEDN
jgi:benzoyl-CoA reductase/2-hydroxyglutaryl-CoA dehydratase subunit BcrC/BadD/HgdB